MLPLAYFNGFLTLIPKILSWPGQLILLPGEGLFLTRATTSSFDAFCISPSPTRPSTDGVQTKAYKEPSRKKPGDGSRPKVAQKKKANPAPVLQIQDFGRRLGTRTSTALKTADTIKIMKAREAESRRKRMKMSKQTKVERKMTQEEILEDAKITAKMNLESLKKYEEMELENRRRAVRSGTRTVQGPAIR